MKETVFTEGEIVHINVPDTNGPELGLIVQFHRRGETELITGVVHVNSGNLLTLKNVSGHAKLSDTSKVLFLGVDVTRNSLTKSNLLRIDQLTNVPFFKKLSEDLFVARGKQKTPFIGKLIKTRGRSLVCLAGVLVRKNYLLQGSIKNKEIHKVGLVNLIKDALSARSDGIWMNPLLSMAGVKALGLPRAYFGTGRRLVKEYNQCIIHVDGTDEARTLGMHKDCDASDLNVNTILGCVASEKGIGKEILVWCPPKVEDMPKWWRTEGLGKDAFEFAKRQCLQNAHLSKCVLFHTLKPGQFIFMPKGLWHWVAPAQSEKWTLMVTSSFY